MAYISLWQPNDTRHEVGILRENGLYYLSLPTEDFNESVYMVREGHRKPYKRLSTALVAARMLYPGDFPEWL
jgi:hypothetical protein